MKLRVFRQIEGHPGKYEHYEDDVAGQRQPSGDDRVYLKQPDGSYLVTMAKILCPTCGRRQAECHCAAPLKTMERVVEEQRRQGTRP